MTSTRSDDEVRRAAADWLARMRGDADAADRVALEAWRSEDSRHAETFDRMVRTLDQTAFLASSAVGRSRDLGSLHRRRRLGQAAVAAGIGVVAVFGASMALRPAAPGAVATVSTVIASASDAARSVKLEDGSVVALARDSQISVSYGTDARRLTLDRGRARFIVASVPGRPFEVLVASVSVVAVGTVFEMSLDEGNVSVAVAKGAVEVRGRARSNVQHWTLAAGEQLVVDTTGKKIVPPASSSNPAVGMMLDFDGLSVARAVAAINRTSKVRVQIDDDVIADRHITGAFRAGDAAGFADAITAMFGLAPPVRSGDVIRIGGTPIPKKIIEG